MIASDLKSLIEKLNSISTQIMYAAGGLAVSRSNYEVAPEHFLVKCLEVKKSDIRLALEHFKVDIPKLTKRLNQDLDGFGTGNTGSPSFSPVLLDLLESAWMIASVDLRLPSIRTGAILLAYLGRPGKFAQSGAPSELSKVSREELSKNFDKILEGSEEWVEPQEAAEGGLEAPGAAPGAVGEDFIAKFCEDFTEKAKKGNIDTVFGRDFEIRGVVDILARRRKNNPILVGNPGVGKTAVVEGLAKRISEGDVPEVLKGVRLVSLDLGLLEAGASVKGEFERRLKGVIDQIKASAIPIVLFIDEAHMLVGAGGSSGGSDAANLLKPALARGELRTIAATTFKEYKKYFEKDAALSRRFQQVTLEEPSVETATLIMRGLKGSYERSHKVVVRDEATVASAELSNRFIMGRYLPDKAFDLMDTACARVKVGLASKPAALEDAEKRIEARNREIKAIQRDQEDLGGEPDKEREDLLNAEIAKDQAEAKRLGELWANQKSKAEKVVALRDALRAAEKEGVPSAPKDSPKAEEPAKAKDAKADAKAEGAPEAAAEAAEPQAAPLSKEEALKAYQEAKAEFDEAVKGEPLVYLEVTADTVAKVVSDWTGIPLGKVASDKARLVAKMEDSLKERIKGQDNAIDAISAVIKGAQAGLGDPVKPTGIFLMVGPSGVGKTETGLAVADLLFGDENNVITINMNEFQEKASVSRLIGSAPGYVGYGEGGLLTEAVSQKPYSVVLLDEAEKAHLDVLNLFYQVFDKGELSDAEGKRVSFRETVIFLTSNLATELIVSLSNRDPQVPYAELIELAKPELSRFFRPALLGRMTVVPYLALSPEALRNILDIKLNKLAKRLQANNGIALILGDEVKSKILQKATDLESGARNIDAIISSNLVGGLSKEILQMMSQSEKLPRKVTVVIDSSGGFAFEFGD
ncbi:MAG: type VI secretion system ATPase TssH [Deltaproteobacteria bacterium]|jgi:type VI secretion system protein VasG|nr:type VI secretion system ATPase TssH [Deltaproteobacteria bacterium]